MHSTNTDFQILYAGQPSPLLEELCLSQGISPQNISACSDMFDLVKCPPHFDGILVSADMMDGCPDPEPYEKLKNAWPFSPIIAAVDPDSDKQAEVFGKGAWDFVYQRGAVELEVKRVIARLMQSREEKSKDAVSVGDISFSLKSRTISNGNKVMSLSPTESRLLSCLIRANGQVVPREKLKQASWTNESVSDNALNRKVHEIRTVLKSLSDRVQVSTVYGQGIALLIRGQ